MGCKQSRSTEHDGLKKHSAYHAGPPAAQQGAPALARQPSDAAAPTKLRTPSDDVLPWACGFGNGQLAVSGIEGNVYCVSWERRALVGHFKAHSKAVNRMLPLPGGLLLTASADATVKMWREGSEGTYGGKAAPEHVKSFTGHAMSVQALASVGDGGDETAMPSQLVTGSRDCTIRLWDVATGAQLHMNKILRNVVTAVRRVPDQPFVVVQCSEDLQIRLWDMRLDASLVKAAPGGPNQLICLDVTDDGRYAVCGSKGFSRHNCEVKLFDIRGGMAQVAATPCADQTIEALRIVSPDRCLIASKDGYIRTILLPEVRVLEERGPAAGAYTALGVERQRLGGPAVLVATASPNGPGLELLKWQERSLSDQPEVLAVAGTGWDDD